MLSRLIAAIVLVASAVVLLVLAWPQLLHLERSQFIAQAVSFRAGALVAAVAVIVVLLLVALISRRSRRVVGSLALLLVLFCALEGIVVVDRGTGDPSFPTKADGDLTVLEWNTLGGATGSDAVAALAERVTPDVIVLPETTEEFGVELQSRLDAAGTRYAVLSRHYDLISKSRSTTMLIADRLGAYAIDGSVGSTKQLPSIVARPVDGSGPTFVAVHVVSPQPAEFATWNADLDWVAEQCAGDDTILAGDFNSTIDHWSHLATGRGTQLGACTDAADATGNAAVGTWPTSFPALAGTPIDHVLTTHEWRTTGMRVIESQDDAGSDHRPILAQLTPVTEKK
jgi:endonuclease/exonuclease/phosphatase (EEP) superfamily protein YafD